MSFYDEWMGVPWVDVQAAAVSSDPAVAKDVRHMLNYGVMQASSLWGKRHPGEVAASERRIYRYLIPVADKLRNAGGGGAHPSLVHGFPVLYPSWAEAINDSTTGCRWPRKITHEACNHFPLAEAMRRLTVIFGDGGPTLADVEQWARRVWVENLLDSPDVVVDVPDLGVLMAEWGRDLDPEIVRSRARSVLPRQTRGIPPTAWHQSHIGFNAG